MKPLSKEELAIPYSKYMELPMDPLPKELRDRINREPLPEEDILPIEKIEDFYRNGFQEKQFGYHAFSDGSGYLAHWMEVPDLSLKQLGWWFGWHINKPEGVPADCGNLRYKIWCPPDHWDHSYVNGVDDREGCIMVESLDLTGGEPVVHSIARSIDPLEAGISQEILSDFKQQGIILQLTHEHSSDMVDRIFTAMMRQQPGNGVLLMSRVWWGWRYENGSFVRDNAEGKRGCDNELLWNNLRHSSHEFNHLRKLLPLLYSDIAANPELS